MTTSYLSIVKNRKKMSSSSFYPLFHMTHHYISAKLWTKVTLLWGKHIELSTTFLENLTKDPPCWIRLLACFHLPPPAFCNSMWCVHFMQELVFHNIKFRDIDWEVSLVLSSRSVGVLDEPLVSVHLGDNKWVIIQFIRNIQSSKVCSEGKQCPWSLTRRSWLL